MTNSDEPERAENNVFSDSAEDLGAMARREEDVLNKLGYAQVNARVGSILGRPSGKICHRSHGPRCRGPVRHRLQLQLKARPPMHADMLARWLPLFVGSGEDVART